jgi:hypothetical protein
MREMVFNDASLAAPLANLHDVCPLLADAARGMAQLTNSRCADTVLRLARPLTEILCATDASLWDALNSLGRVARDEALFLMRIAQKVPLYADLPKYLAERWNALEPAEHNGEGLVLCALSGAIAIGLPFSERWDHDHIEVRFSELNDDETISEVTETVDHLARSIHAAAIIERHRESMRSELSRENFWEHRDQAFPNLSFGLDVADHLRKVEASQFGTILNRLRELDKAASEWKAVDAAAPAWPCKVTPESKSTMANREAERVFRGADGDDHVFEWHARFGGLGRIHLRLVAERRLVEIGYIGRKLATTKYPT